MIFEKTKNKKLCSLQFSCSSNNTIGTIINPKGDVIFSVSAGHFGYKNSKKGSQSAAQLVTSFCGQEAIKLGNSSVILRLKGLGRGRNSVVKDLLKVGLKIVKIVDVTPISFNGCRPPKGSK